MSASLASDVRPAAAAGRFYPADPGELGFQVDRLMVRARGGTPFGATPPKAIVVPHAGYRSSGAVAADAYARLGAAALPNHTYRNRPNGIPLQLFEQIVNEVSPKLIKENLSKMVLIPLRRARQPTTSSSAQDKGRKSATSSTCS